MTRTRRFLGGITFGYLHLVVVTIVGLWLTPFFLSHLGQRDYGLWLVAAQLLSYLLLLDLGVVALLPRETAFVVGRLGFTGGAAELHRLVAGTTRIVLWQTVLVALTAGAVWLLLPADWEPLRRPLAWIFIVLTLTFPLRIFGAVLQGLQDLAFLARTQLIAWALGTAITVWLVMKGFGLEALAVGWVVTQISSAAVCGLRLLQRFSGAWSDRPAARSEAIRPYLTKAGWVSLAQVAQVLLTGSDLFVIGILLGPAAVVPYACTAKLATVLANHPQLLMRAASPALSELRAGETRERLYRVSTALSQAMLLASGFVVTVVLAINEGFVTWWVGEAQYGGATLTILVLLAMLARHWNVTLVYSLFCFGHERHLAIVTFVDGIVTVGGIAVFVAAFGPIGAPLGALLGAGLVSLPWNLRTLATEYGRPPGDLVRSLGPWAWRFAAVALAAFMLGRAWSPAEFLPLALEAAGVALVYLIVLLPMARRSPVGPYLNVWSHFRARPAAGPIIGPDGMNV